MRRLVTMGMLGIVALLCSGSSCSNKGFTTGMLLDSGGLFRKDPIQEPMFYSRDFPGIPNPYAPANLDTRFDLYAPKSVRLGNLFQHDLSFFGLTCFDDGAGFTPTVIADQVWTVPGDGTYSIGVRDFLGADGYTSPTPDPLRCKLRVGGALTLGGKKELKEARKTFLGGGEPFPFTSGVKSAAAWSVSVRDASGNVVSLTWGDVPVFAQDAFD
jgi:hypothetical protein